ncbi:PKD domain-containing protein [Methanosarcina sp.]|uniref:PKD domain-containing protein n=1 Tax=Methanosarcina sp. TaxID=2213 RepID=UPI003C71AA79
MNLNLNPKLLTFLVLLLAFTAITGGAASAVEEGRSGGPDYFGYTFEDSNVAGGPVYDWIEIAWTGTRILPCSDDKYVNGIPVGFLFNYYGTDYSQVSVTNNGITLPGDGTNQWENQPIGSSTLHNFISPFWDDLVTWSSDGAVYYQVIGEAPNRKLVVEWFENQHRTPSGASPSGGTFEAIIYEGTNDIKFQYKDVDFGSDSYNNGVSATVGIESDDGRGLQYSYNEPVISPGLAILFKYPAPVTVEAGEDKTADEGTGVDFEGTITASGPHTYTSHWDFGDGSEGDNSLRSSHTYADNGVYTVILTVTDEQGNSASDTLTVSVSNVAPDAGEINSPFDPVQLGTQIKVGSTFTDPGILDTHTAVWDWGDDLSSDGSVTENGGSGTVSGEHTYSSVGIYEVTLTVTDDDSGTDYSVSKYVVIFDPEGGFVTGGGWINSPAGAYVPDPSLEGTANFGFVSKYKNGATVPTGVTQFQFQVADLNFHSNNYDWLVVAGARAQYKGTGTINGAGEYSFMLTAIDSELNGGGSSDKFRIKIWDKASGAVVYDNMLQADDNADPTTELQGGSITIHKEK